MREWHESKKPFLETETDAIGSSSRSSSSRQALGSCSCSKESDILLKTEMNRLWLGETVTKTDFRD